MRGCGHIADHSDTADVDDDTDEEQEVGQGDNTDWQQERYDQLIRMKVPIENIGMLSNEMSNSPCSMRISLRRFVRNL